MKAAGKFLAVAYAAVLSLGLLVPAGIAIQFVSATEAEAAVVRSIDVQGNRRIDDATVINYVGIQPGRPFDNDDINNGVVRLFETGLFADVRINQRGSVLVIVVDEHAVINQVIFQGNRKIKDDKLALAVKLQPRGSFSNVQLEADIQAIRDAYGAIGRDDATVTGRAIDLGEGRVNVVFEIVEGDRTKIARIEFVGNQAYGDGRLRDVISTKRSNVLSFFLRNDIYDEQKLRADEDALRRFYFNRGYADFQVVSSYADLNEAENEYVITITIDEGQRYRFGEIDIETTIQGVDPAMLRGELETRPGDRYSAEEVEETLIGLTERMAGMGYAFAQVSPRGDRDFTNQTISIVFSIDEGPRAYIERIEIRGNTRTRDYVIRREFDLAEGDAFNQVLIQRAKKRLEELDFFQTVEISTLQGSEPDQVVVLVTVEEKSTGELGVGVGYSLAQTSAAAGGVSIEGSISERNFLGRGQFIRFSAAGGRTSRDFMFSFTEPYFLGRRIAAGFDIYRQTREYDTYNSALTGGTIRFGLPITEELSAQIAYNLTGEKYNYEGGLGALCPAGFPACPVAPSIQAAIGGGTWIKSSVSNTLTYNTIDDMQNPREGVYISGTAEFAGLGGNARFAKFFGNASYYHLLSEELDIVGLVSVGGGHVVGLGGGGLRVFDHFQGNDRIIRGFEYNGIGPVDLSSREHLGGRTYFNASAEIQAPLPIIPESFGFRGAVFADAATLHGNRLINVDPATVGSAFRASIGTSLIWASPFGPLRVDFAWPILKRPTDKVQNFNFGLSTRF